MPDGLKFKDGKALEAWLKDKPVDWAQAIGARSALRVFPLVFSVAHLPASKSTAGQTQGLILRTWRAVFVSWAACKYPAPDMRAAATTAADVRNVYPARAASAARHASRAASRAASGIAATAIAIGATNAAAAAATEIAADADAEIWAAILADCQWLSNNGKGLIERPLWPSDVRGNTKFQANFPPWAREEFDAFAAGELAKTTSWSLIVSWYRAVLPNSMSGKPRSLFGEKADVQIAMQPDKFWDREPETVLKVIAKIAGWKPDDSQPLPAGTSEKVKSVGKSAKAAMKKSAPGSSRGPNDPVTPPPDKKIPLSRRKLRSDVRSHSDEPTLHDGLERGPFAQMLVDSMDDVRQQGAPDGFAVHIHAPWGAGKTSILLMMEKAMTEAARPPDKQWAVVHFNAWKNERRKPPWWPLIQQTYACCRESLWKDGRYGRWFSLNYRWMFWRFRADLLPYAISAIVLLFFAYFWSSSAANGSWLEALPNVFTEGPGRIFGVIAALVAAVLPIVTIARAIAFGSPSNAQFYSDLSSDPLKRITRLFTSIVARTRKPVAIFIDDLDRCDADYVVDLLEGIQTLFRGQDVAYVVAADRAWIKAAFESRYDVFSGHVGDAGQPLGYLFLEKIFQVSTAVPGMGAQIREDYWASLIDDDHNLTVSDGVDSHLQPAKAKEAETKAREEFDRRVVEVRDELKEEYGANVTSAMVNKFLTKKGASAENRAAAALELNVSVAAKKEAEHLLSGFRDIVGEVPRVMKRMINAFAMRRALGMLEGSTVPNGALVRWTILEQRWPALADLLIDNPEWLNDLAVKQSEAKLAKLEPALQPFANRPPIQAVLGRKNEGGLTSGQVGAIVRGSANDPDPDAKLAARVSTRRRNRTQPKDQPPE